MSQYDELKRLAEAATIGDKPASTPIKELIGAQDAFRSECRPEKVLSLIAENEELGRYLCTCRDCGGEGSLHTGDWHSYSPMEPPEPVMEKCGECDGTGLLGEIQDLYQVITERDQLKAEVAGLRTGYQAYERVNAELKAENERLTMQRDTFERNCGEVLDVVDRLKTENEALRKRIDDVSPFKGAPMTGPDTKCLACGGHHSGLGGLPCPKMSPVAQALSMENQRVTPVEPLRNEHDDAAEREAQKIYDSWAGHDGFVPWVKGGNSIKQDEARRLARAAMGKGEQS